MERLSQASHCPHSNCLSQGHWKSIGLFRIVQKKNPECREVSGLITSWIQMAENWFCLNLNFCSLQRWSVTFFSASMEGNLCCVMGTFHRGEASVLRLRRMCDVKENRDPLVVSEELSHGEGNILGWWMSFSTKDAFSLEEKANL